jgi:tetratricopeptide (TPR) repeat protein
MRPMIGCALILAAATAAAGPSPTAPRRKPATDKLTPEALSTFVDAIVADKAGDLDTAARRYEDASRTDPQPNVAFNLADVYRRMEKIPKAIKSYQKYLELAPDAADRKEVERLIAQLGKTPAVVVIDGEDLDAVVLVDGKLVGPSPAVVRPATGKHTADRIGPASFRHHQFEAKPTATEQLRSNSDGETGNVVISGSPMNHYAWTDRDIPYEIGRRMTFAPGHYETYLSTPSYACSPIVFDVPRGDDLTYVYIDAGTPTNRGDCVPIKVRQQTIRLPPAPAKQR